jgi:hypothetical protein
LARLNAPFQSVNGGEVGREVQGRINLEGYGATASLLENILPQAAGPMSFRPGLKFCVEAPEVAETDEEESASGEFPTVEATSTGTQAISPGPNGTFSINLPSGVSSGDLVIVTLMTLVDTGGAGSGVPVHTTPAGWELIGSHGMTSSGLGRRFSVFARETDGGEGTTLSLDVSDASGGVHRGAWNCYRISGHEGLPEIGSFDEKSLDNPNPPLLTPTWGAARTLWLAVGGFDSPHSYGAPTNYTDFIVADGGAALAFSARRTLFAAGEDPDIFAWPGAPSFPNIAVAATVGIRAATVEAPPPDDTTIIEEFIFTSDQKHLLLLTNGELRIVEDGGIVIREDVGIQVVNGAFLAGLVGWTNYSTGESTAEGGDLGLVLFCDGPNEAGVRQSLAVVNPGVVHGINVEVTRGPAILRIGTSAGLDDILAETILRTGTHRLSFEPNTTFWVDISANVRREVIVERVDIATAGDLVLDTPWTSDLLRSLRFEQSLNVMYVADGVHPKRRIERHGAASWSVTLSDEQDGPFLAPNTDETIIVTPSTRVGNGTLTSTKSLFRPEDAGSLLRITQNGQYQARAVTGADQWTSPAVRVTGVGTARDLTWTVEGTFVGTVRLQRSVGNDSTWEDVASGTGTFTTTAPGTFAFRDGEDNATIFYRVGIKAGEYTSGTADVTIFFPGGATDGVARITAVTSTLSADMEVLTSFAALTGSSEWARGAWSDFFGWPRAPAVWDGRLWNGRGADFWGSVSEVYESQAEGDEASDAIARTVSVTAQSPSILWMLGLNRLIIGTSASAADVQPVVVQTGLVSVQASQLDEAVTPSNLTVRGLDAAGVYVDESNSRPMEIVWSPEAGTYRPRALDRLHRSIGRGGILQLAFARRPDLRLFMIRSDGQCLVKLFDRDENALGWCRLITDGAFESVAVLQADDEDEVYFIVRRTVNGEDVRYLEKLDPFFLDDATDANFLDSYVRYEDADGVTNVPDGTALHLAGEDVRVWADGAYMGVNTVTAAGALGTALRSLKSSITIGFYYRGRYRSSKLAFGAQAGTALGQKGRPSSIALLLLGSTRQIRYGADFDTMDQLPDLSGDVTYDAGPGLIDDTTDFFPIPAGHSRDPRLCLEIEAPHPVTIQGYVLGFHLDEKVKA